MGNWTTFPLHRTYIVRFGPPVNLTMSFYSVIWITLLPSLCRQQLTSEYVHLNNGGGQGKCTYTFVVPHQKITGAVCVSTAKFPEAFGVNRSEVEELKQELSRQQNEIEKIKRLVDVDHEVANEMDHLQRENRNMGSRLSHLHMQFLHEVLQKKNDSKELFQGPDKAVNTTAEVLTLASKYQDLQEKYNFLTSLINNQSLIIARLEEQCLQSIGKRQGDQVPSYSHLPSGTFSNSSEGKKKQNRDTHGEQIDGTSNRKEILPTQAVKTTSTAPVDKAESSKSEGPWADCYEAFLAGQKSSAIYLLKPRNSSQIMQAWCDQENHEGGWTVIQRRQDGSTNFFKTWHNYKHGFGNLDNEYWLGLENIYWLTKQGSYKLLILMDDWQGRQVSAEYDQFRVEPESDFYRLRLGQYSGTAGDSLSWHNDKQFSTLDKDRDSYSGNCAHFQKGGWWYNMCAHSNLNGVWYRGGHYRSRYQDGVYWAEFRGGAYSLKKVVMLIKPDKQ
ncbi:angiopoietin-related protein 6 isoform X3 [Hyla sarda]|uniref:angiopoietin-related protein 6 isoform X3 n=1 Tax=Hyla sarda TaxID=327740 RepID=UPI0024C33C72|nr:angiopoietin-related protein 6 isoform X3 [Hyla sarda]